MTLTGDHKNLLNKKVYKIQFKLKNPVFFPIYIQDISMTSLASKLVLGINLPFVLTHQGEGQCTLFVPLDEWDSISTTLISKLKDKEYFEKIVSGIQGEYKKLNALIKDCADADPVTIYPKYVKTISDFRAYAMIPNYLTLGNNSMEDTYKQFLTTQPSISEMTILSSPHALSQATLAEKAILKLMEKGATDNELQQWIDKWGYIYYYYLGPIPDIDDTKKLIEQLNTTYKDKKARIEEISNYEQHMKQQKKELQEKLSLNEQDIHLLNVISFLNHYKQERKELMQKSYVAFDTVFKKIEKETGMALSDLKYLTVSETINCISTKDTKKYANIIHQRKKEFVTLTVNEKMQFLTPEEKKEAESLVQLVIPNQKLMPAFIGPEPVKGKLIIINSKEDMEKIKDLTEPFILASSSTYPDLLPAMGKCAGIVTKIGGMTSHAAIVAREMKKPCIVGYTKLFEDFAEGDYVQLDPQNSSMIKIKKL